MKCTKCQDSNNCLNVEKISEDSIDSEDIANELEQPRISLSPENEETETENKAENENEDAENDEAEYCSDTEET